MITQTSSGKPPVLPEDIERLSERLINQIAAGEVITRPAAALKEIIENSIDAGATRIEIAVEEGALSFSVRDNGRGMREPDLNLSVERHATSKIRDFDDLMNLATRGFRGEALAAISAVSRLEILTRTADSTTGFKLKTSGGLDTRINPEGAPVGTIIHVKDLFFNTPVRGKFLKSAVAEWGHMLKTIIRQSLTRPDIGFSVRWRNKPYLNLPENQVLIDRLAEVLPSGLGAELIPVDHTLHEVRVYGAVTGPRKTRRDRRHQYFFVNGRPVVFRPVTFAMEEAFRGLLMTQQYPLCALLIELPGGLVDVNVHPTKEEVRFQNEPLIGAAAHRAVKEALLKAELVPTLNIPTPGDYAGKAHPVQSLMTREGTKHHVSAPGITGGIPACTGFPLNDPAIGHQKDGSSGPAGGQPEFHQRFGFQTDPVLRTGMTSTGSSQGTPDYPEPAAQDESTLLHRLCDLPEKPQALAQIALTYILAGAGNEGMLVIDQHAAHEKIMYMKMTSQFNSKNPAVEMQPLLIPHQLEVAPEELGVMEDLIPALGRSGFEIEPFGNRTFIVQSVPVIFENLNVELFLRDLLDDVGQGNLGKELERTRDKICARASCRSAVKSGDHLSPREQQQLVDELLTTAELMRCPHGRPTTLILTREQLDRQFGRLA
jgi:DNA mismatch repair protein MutL